MSLSLFFSSRRRHPRFALVTGVQACVLPISLHEGVDALLGGPAHVDKVGNRNARYRRRFNDWHHGIAMAAQNEGRDILHAYLELVCQEVAETRAIQNACHAHDLVMGQPGKFPQRPYHCVERIGDADDKSVRRIRSEEHTSELQSLMRISYAVFCLQK